MKPRTTADKSRTSSDELVQPQKESSLRFQQATGQLGNAARLKTVKRDVARVKNVLTKSRCRGICKIIRSLRVCQT